MYLLSLLCAFLYLLLLLFSSSLIVSYDPPSFVLTTTLPIMSFRPIDTRWGGPPQQKHPNAYPTELPMRPNERPPTHTSGVYSSGVEEKAAYSRKNPKNWPRRCWAFVAATFFVLLALVVAVAVVVSRENRYPGPLTPKPSRYLC